jgi:hypothetical protein
MKGEKGKDKGDLFFVEQSVDIWDVLKTGWCVMGHHRIFQSKEEEMDHHTAFAAQNAAFLPSQARFAYPPPVVICVRIDKV